MSLVIDLKNVKKSDFWNISGFTFDSLQNKIQNEIPDLYKINIILYSYTNRPQPRILELRNSNDKYINCNLEDCINFDISISKFNEIYLGYLTTKCKIKSIKSGLLLHYMDQLAIAFNIRRIFLKDKARTLDSGLDLTLLTVMKDNKTFYEKYGFETCEPLNDIPHIELSLHKNLLRNFPFNLFYEHLDFGDKGFLRRFLRKLDKKIEDFEYLWQFYVKMHRYFDKKKDLPGNRKLQEILQNQKYPWNSMVDVIQNQKICMEKYLSH